MDMREIILNYYIDNDIDRNILIFNISRLLSFENRNFKKRTTSFEIIFI